LDIYINIHTYGQVWMPIWGYTTALPSDYVQLSQVAQIGVNALRAVYGTPYTLLSPGNAFGASAGGLMDWARGVANVPWPFALELRPGQTGVDSQHGFTLPEDRVPFVGEETYKGIIAMIKAIKDRS